MADPQIQLSETPCRENRRRLGKDGAIILPHAPGTDHVHSAAVAHHLRLPNCQRDSLDRAAGGAGRRNEVFQGVIMEIWLGRLDSNQGMAESKSAALPLGYAPTVQEAAGGA